MAGESKNRENKIPSLSSIILERIIPMNEHEALIGDFDEIYTATRDTKGRFRAFIWLWFQVAKFFISFIKDHLSGSAAMLKNYITISFRNLKKNKFFSLINVTGLSVGIAACILIMLYIQDELSYDRFHENADRIYRLTVKLKIGNQPETLTASNASKIGPVFKDEFPEILSYVRIQNYGSRRVVTYQDKTYNENRFLWADSTLFNVFSFRLLKGDKNTALKAPFSVVVTEEIADKYFGDEDPLGKILTVAGSVDYTVTGVMENIRGNSSIRPDFIGSLTSQSLYNSGNMAQDLLSNMNFHNFFLLRNKESAETLQEKLPDFVEVNIGEVLRALNASVAFNLQPLRDIFLRSNLMAELERTSDIRYVYLFASIGFFILMIACLNYMNLSTARSSNRAKEVGMRKVVGARRQNLAWQFIGESFVVAFISVILALIIAQIFLPQFNTIARKQLSLSYLSDPELITGIAGFLFFVTFIGGSYPAFFLSAFKPVQVIKGVIKGGTKSSILRIVLVSLQFTVSIALIAGTLIVYEQLDYLRNKKLGYEKDHVLWFLMRSEETQTNYKAIKEKLLQNPNIIKASASGNLPLGQTSDTIHHPEGKPEGFVVHTTMHLVDDVYIGLYNMEIIKGRNFSEEFPSDYLNGAIVNETAIRNYGWEDDPIGKYIEYYTGIDSKVRKTVIGVVKDYHFESLRQPITPLVLYRSINFENNQAPMNIISLKIMPENIQETVSYIESVWKEFDQKFPFEYGFVDERYDSLYRSEERLGKLFGLFTFLAIGIGCLGLLGLASYTAEQRTKEIGIRKSLGASAPGILVLMVREFIKWIIVANVIALPLSYFLMNQWLQDFAYRADIGFGVFLMSGSAALLIGILTVSYQTIKASLLNPVNSLRYE